MQRSTRRFGRVATNRFSCMCDMSLADGIHFAVNGKQCLVIPLSNALICVFGRHISGGYSRAHGCVDDVNFVFVSGASGH